MRASPRRLLLLLACCAGASLPLVSHTVVEGARPVRERVQIRRDTFGVPHIRADDEEAAGFGFGYAQAEDHAEEMGRRYLEARGEAARQFGRASLENDVAMQRLDNRGAAARAVASLGRPFRRWLGGFVAGFNHYVAQHRGELPPWMPVITEADVLAHGRNSSVEAALSPPRALLAKYPGAPAARPTLGGITARPPAEVEGGEDDTGSNAFALAGSRTTSGRPILLGNPHLTWRSRYWEAHVTIPGRLDFYGSTLVGIPVLRAGFNDRLGYVQTNNYPDLADIYRLPLDPADPGRYLFEGRARPLTSVVVSVDVHENDGSVTTERREYLASHVGPIVHRTDRDAFAVRSMALESWRTYEGFYELTFSRSLRDFERRLSRNLHYFSNFTYADADGNVLYQWNARLPKRPDPLVDYSLDVPGDSPRLFWRSLHRVSELPRLLNPRGGYVQNANNTPWWTSLRDPLDPVRYPGYIERDPPGLRPQVVLDGLESRDRFSPEDALALKFTTRMLVAERVLPDLFAAADDPVRAAAPTGSPREADIRAGLTVLERWDRQVASASRGAVLFQRFWDIYRQDREAPFAEPFDPARPLATPRGLADPTAALDALALAVTEVRVAHGALDVAWGDVHRFRFEGIDLPADGAASAYGVYRVLGFQPVPGGQRVAGRLSAAEPLVGNGDAWILLVHFTRPVQAQSVLAYGQTTRAGSPHTSDQIALFAAHQLRPARFTEADIRAHLERSYRP